MEFDDVVNARRAYRAYKKTDITDEMVEELVTTASLSPSCNNFQPWRFVMIREKEQLEKVFATLTPGNYWMKKASMVVAVFTEPGSDCEVQGVKYEMFDTGMATAFLMLKAQDMGLITHPIAGFNKAEVKKVLGIPEHFTMITLIGIGKKNEDLSFLGEKHQQQEVSGRTRDHISEFAFHETYG
jgi:nitroreductase